MHEESGDEEEEDMQSQDSDDSIPKPSKAVYGDKSKKSKAEVYKVSKLNPMLYQDTLDKQTKKLERKE